MVNDIVRNQLCETEQQLGKPNSSQILKKKRKSSNPKTNASGIQHQETGNDFGDLEASRISR